MRYTITKFTKRGVHFGYPSRLSSQNARIVDSSGSPQKVSNTASPIEKYVLFLRAITWICSQTIYFQNKLQSYSLCGYSNGEIVVQVCYKILVGDVAVFGMTVFNLVRGVTQRSKI